MQIFFCSKLVCWWGLMDSGGIKWRGAFCPLSQRLCPHLPPPPLRTLKKKWQKSAIFGTFCDFPLRNACCPLDPPTKKKKKKKKIWCRHCKWRQTWWSLKAHSYKALGLLDAFIGMGYHLASRISPWLFLTCQLNRLAKNPPLKTIEGRQLNKAYGSHRNWNTFTHPLKPLNHG